MNGVQVITAFSFTLPNSHQQKGSPYLLGFFGAHFQKSLSLWGPHFNLQKRQPRPVVANDLSRVTQLYLGYHLPCSDSYSLLLSAIVCVANTSLKHLISFYLLKSFLLRFTITPLCTTCTKLNDASLLTPFKSLQTITMAFLSIPLVLLCIPVQLRQSFCLSHSPQTLSHQCHPFSHSFSFPPSRPLSPVREQFECIPDGNK